jgi:pilus assembly protein Flp/PilA
MKEEDDMVRYALQYVRGFVRNEEAQDLLEYALLVALIAVVAIAAVTGAGDKVVQVFQQITEDIPGGE